ncbi:MAG: hypothetical protein K8L97_22495 [Anaerolineae bacterium]|nr:hypothetical protein [Anaerolineae bacterium]
MALLAPFEGRYREVGYNAYYAARLAIQDFDNPDIELLTIDDGGTAQNAADRAQALAGDPLIKAVIVLGYAATDSQTQQAFGDLPVLVVGGWGAKPETDTVFMLINPELAATIGRIEITDTSQPESMATGGEVLALEQFPKLRPDVQGMVITSSASLPDAAFRERYINSGLFVPEPGLLATLTYDAFGMVLQTIQNGDVQSAFNTMTYDGVNGTIRFEGGYWADAPIHRYQYYSDGILKPATP